VSKERAQRRAEREREAAVMAAARAAEAERKERREARHRTLTGWLPKRRRPTGILAERRRKQTGATIAMLLALNVLVWVFLQDWGISLAALVVSLLAAPVLYTMLFRRS
jgi:hypothetical protein